MATTNTYICIHHFLYISLVCFFSYGAAIRSNPTCSLPTLDNARESQELQIKHNYRTCSQDKSPSSQEIFLRDELRVISINKKHTSNQYSTESESDGHVPQYVLSIGAGTFTVNVGFGTPVRHFKLIFDTGSDVTWIKCKPCLRCSLQNELVFDPLMSSSYSNSSCIPVYKDPYIKYMDESHVNVRYVCDTILLQPSDVISKFTFGCGLENSEDFAKVDGILSLGKGDLSVVSQTAFKFGKVFTYCLPTSTNSPGRLLFGEAAKRISASTSLKYTPLLAKSDFYYITLIGISVGLEKINVSPSVFQSAGTILDSGTVITRLPEPAYSALKIVFKKFMSKYTLTEELPPLLDTCYNLLGIENVVIPEIVLHFGGGTDVKLNPSGVVWKPKESLAQVCLAFAPTKKLTIIGNNQQLGLEVFHDLEGNRIGFGTNSC